MQLMRRRRRPGKVRETIAALSAGLVAAGIGSAHEAAAQDYYTYNSPAHDRGYNESTGLLTLPYSELDTSMLIYQESGGRVQAIEPSASLTVNGAAGQILNLTLTADSLTGATPNGAVPSDLVQKFVTPIKAQGSSVSVTNASGGSTIIHLPPTPGQIAQAALGRQYTVQPNTLPVDLGFHDDRASGSFNWSQPLAGITQVGFGAGYSSEHDFSAFTANAMIAQSFNANNTTLSLAGNFEDDSSAPYGGVPTPLTQMTAVWKTPSSRSRTSEEAVLGLTQVLTRRWLAQLNYSYSYSSGYQNDPYRILSVVDPTSGEPLDYLYENRPGKRTRQSVYLDTKYDWGPTITEVQSRFYKDDWGLKAVSAEISQRVDLAPWLYVTPDVRWYHQTAANFFHYYLVSGDPLPAYASSDSRLGAFTAMTYGGQIGVRLSQESSIYLRGAYYDQTGNGHPADAIGQLKNQNLFAGVKAEWVMAGYTWDFH
jgi:hypothetical protein